MIYLTADVFFYNFALILLESACGNKSDHKPNENVFLVNGCVLALIASILISHVSFTAYENIHFRDLNGEIDYSTNPEESIAISSLYLILLFFINLIGAIELYKRVNICTIKVTPQWIMVLKIQIQAYKIRFFRRLFIFNCYFRIWKIKSNCIFYKMIKIQFDFCIFY